MSTEFPKESVPGDVHTLSRDGGFNDYDVYKLIEITKNLPTVELDVNLLDNMALDDMCWIDSYENRMAPRELLLAARKFPKIEDLLNEHHEWAYHIRKLEKADCSYPVLVLEGEVIDGMHRLVKALLNGYKTIPAKVLESLPDEALYRPNKQK